MVDDRIEELQRGLDLVRGRLDRARERLLGRQASELTSWVEPFQTDLVDRHQRELERLEKQFDPVIASLEQELRVAAARPREEAILPESKAPAADGLGSTPVARDSTAPVAVLGGPNAQQGDPPEGELPAIDRQRAQREEALSEFARSCVETHRGDRVNPSEMRASYCEFLRSTGLGPPLLPGALALGLRRYLRYRRIRLRQGGRDEVVYAGIRLSTRGMRYLTEARRKDPDAGRVPPIHNSSRNCPRDSSRGELGFEGCPRREPAGEREGDRPALDVDLTKGYGQTQSRPAPPPGAA